MDETVKLLLNNYGFQPLVQGIYRQVQLQLQLRRNTALAGGFVVSGDTGYVYFNGVFDFKSSKWIWDRENKHWLMPQSVIDSPCGYKGDDTAALQRLKSACADHMGGAVTIVLA